MSDRTIGEYEADGWEALDRSEDGLAFSRILLKAYAWAKERIPRYNAEVGG